MNENGKRRRKKALGEMISPARVMGICLLVLCLCFGSMAVRGKGAGGEGNDPAFSPAPALHAAEAGGKIEKGCEIIQTMGFLRCGHSVTRRITAPDELIGADFEAARQYYELWMIEDFSGGKMAMHREIPLFCPMHWVLMMNEMGEIVLARNRYGDGMAAVKSYPGKEAQLKEETLEMLGLGLAFDSEEEAEGWLAKH